VSDNVLFPGDTGRLADASRRALLELIRGPYLSADQNPAVWSALRSDETEIRSRLHDLFLDLIVDADAGFAFVRNVPDVEAAGLPRTIRAAPLTFLDTAMLLVLRQLLLAAHGERRVIVGREEVFEQLAVYRTVDRDERDFERRMNASWLKMRNTLRVVHATGRAENEDRVELSPVLRLIVDAEQVRAIRDEYAALVARGGRADAAADDTEEADA
jgi:hypothetical protein